MVAVLEYSTMGQAPPEERSEEPRLRALDEKRRSRRYFLSMRKPFGDVFVQKAARAWRKCAASFRGLSEDGKPREDSDEAQVVRAARLLQISEFEFFRVAYSGWYGREIKVEETERFFTRYLQRKEIPFWVRHLARRVPELHSRDALVPKDFGVDRPSPTRENDLLKIVCGLLLGVIYSLFFLVLAGYYSP